MPGADIWDDDDEPVEDQSAGAEVIELGDRLPGVLDGTEAGGDVDDDDVDEDETWLIEAQVVPRVDDEGPHDGSRGVEVDEEDSDEAFGSKLQRWGATSVLGASLSGIGLGIDKAVFGRESTQIEIEADDDDDGRRDPIQVKLDPDDPDRSVAVLRPWMEHPSGRPGD